MNTMQQVKTGATPEARHFTAMAAQHAGLRVHCGGGAYRSFGITNCGGLYAAVEAAIDSARNAPFSGDAPADLLQRIEPLEVWEVV